MNNEMSATKGRVTSIQINGIVAHLIFASEGDAEAIAVVKDILKGACIRSQKAQ